MDAWINWVLIIILVSFSALFSGLTLGLMGLDTGHLQILMNQTAKSDEEYRQKKYAAKIYPIRRKGNLLLCTLLLGNVAVNAILSILLADMTGGLVGFLASTGLIVIFGEITPQSICNRWGLAVGAKVVYLMWLIIGLLFPIAYPISWVLDKVLGEDLGSVMSRNEMKSMFDMYASNKYLTEDERNMLSSILDFKEKKVKEIMKPLDQIYMLEIDSILDSNLLKEIYEKGYSRIPVYEGKREHIRGILYSKDLIALNPQQRLLKIRQLSHLFLRAATPVHEESTLNEIFATFKQGHSHLGVVHKVIENEYADNLLENVGLITMEDLIEILLHQDIEDEKDVEARGHGSFVRKHMSLLFMNKTAEKNLSLHEIDAVCSFLSTRLKSFAGKTMRYTKLEALVKNSEVIHLSPNMRKHSEIKEESEHSIEIPSGERKTSDADVEADADGDDGDGDGFKNPGNYRLSLQENNLKNRASFTDHQEIELRERFKTHAGVADASNSELNIWESYNRSDVQEGRNKYLYKRKVKADYFCLILSGVVEIVSGREGFKSTGTSFTPLGEQALVEENYHPDFTAKSLGDIKFLRIKREEYLSAIS
mmetsp:Transcript_4414/g.4944  ORF Transcript_4414/g.4944 Transcript_4414/m.4944 type:complete len:594 (+) Transcript_4414:155-1936(+)